MTRNLIYWFTHKGKGLVLMALCCISDILVGQTPLITVRFANPQNECATGEYCLDVEFKSDLADQEVFGMNVRFFYDDQLLEFMDFRDYQGGYGPVAPDPPIITTSGPAGPALFNFDGAAEFVNGAIQLVNTGELPLYLDTENWTKIFQVCFNLDGPIMNLDTFCPPVVWDLEQDPANGGFLAGDDGVVITVVDPDPNNESLAADENVVQFNWQYIGNGSAPYGEPIEETCSNVNCALPVTFIEFSGRLDQGVVVLDWQVVDEFNLKGYSIQRCTDKYTWQSIGYVVSAGTGSQLYTYSDTHPHPGANYYRILAEDIDLQTHASGLIHIGLSANGETKGMMIYPNPAVHGVFELSLDFDPGPVAQITIYSSTGTQVLTQVCSFPRTEISVVDLVPGLYTVVVTTSVARIERKLSILR